MIFGHRFDFVSEAALQKAYSSFSSAPSTFPDHQIIQVIESSKSAVLDALPLKSPWVEMSGQEARYYSAVPFDEADDTFGWALEVKDIVTLVWDASDQNILYAKGKNYTHQRLYFWVFHTFFPILLELQRKYRLLHAGAVEIEGKPVLFSAFSFGGKSTMTDYFIKKGHVMLSDDSVGIDKRGDSYYAIASYPFHRPYREAETLGDPVEKFAIEPKQLHAVYLLERSQPDGAVEIEELKGIEKFKAFHYSSFINFSFMKQERFDFFAEMAKYIPVYKIKVPWSLERLDEVYKGIVKHSIAADAKK